MNKSKIKIKEVWSANNWYLFYGIISIIMIILLEWYVITAFFIKPLNEAIGLAIILQLPCFLCSLSTTMISDWKNRTKFNLYYYKLETCDDIKYIEKYYSVKYISQKCIIFVEKEDSDNFSTWNLQYGYRKISELEEKLFE